MIPLVCENFLCGTNSPNMVTGCLRNFFKWIKNSRQRVWEYYSSGTNSPDKTTACLIKLLKWNSFLWYRDSLCEKIIYLSCSVKSQLSIKKTSISGNPHCFYRYTTDKFILLNILTKGSWCLSGCNFPVCANFIHFTKKYQRSFWTTLTYSYFYHNIFEISQSQHRIVRVGRSYNKKSFGGKLFQFCDLKTQQLYILQE